MTTISLINADTSLSIKDISEPVIYEYFTKLNKGEFMATAELFTEQGCLTPPFDKVIQGRKAIAQYLEREAKGIKSYPEQGEMLKSGLLTQYQIQGKVDISQFVFAVDWFMQLDNAQKIMSVEVKLSASLEDLLNFK